MPNSWRSMTRLHVGIYLWGSDKKRIWCLLLTDLLQNRQSYRFLSYSAQPQVLICVCSLWSSPWRWNAISRCNAETKACNNQANTRTSPWIKSWVRIDKLQHTYTYTHTHKDLYANHSRGLVSIFSRWWLSASWGSSSKDQASWKEC
jgi:hypothetical protein